MTAQLSQDEMARLIQYCESLSISSPQSPTLAVAARAENPPTAIKRKRSDELGSESPSRSMEPRPVTHDPFARRMRAYSPEMTSPDARGSSQTDRNVRSRREGSYRDREDRDSTPDGPRDRDSNRSQRSEMEPDS